MYDGTDTKITQMASRASFSSRQHYFLVLCDPVGALLTSSGGVGGLNGSLMESDGGCCKGMLSGALSASGG